MSTRRLVMMRKEESFRAREDEPEEKAVLRVLEQNDSNTSLVRDLVDEIESSGNADGETTTKRKRKVKVDATTPYLTHAHVRAIEKGNFIYDPELVQTVADLSRRLANLDHYVTDLEKEGGATDDDPDASNKTVRVINPRMTEVLLNDVEDFLQVISKIISKMEFIREYHEDTHCEIMEQIKNERNESAPQQSGGWCAVLTAQAAYVWHNLVWAIGLGCYPSRFIKGITNKYDQPMPRRLTLPHAFEKNRRQQLYGAVYEGFLEVANIGSDILFITTQLHKLIGTSWAPLFYVSAAALALTFIGRLMVGLADYRLVDWKDRRRVQKYFVGLLVGLIEPNTGFNDLVKRSFKVQETLGHSIIGESVGSFVKDPIATQAKADYKAARMSILTAAILLVQDIPLIVVEILFIISFQQGNFNFVYWIALATSLLSAFRQLVEAYKLLQDIPGLRNIVLVRHLVLDPDEDSDYKSAMEINEMSGRGTNGSTPMLEIHDTEGDDNDHPRQRKTVQYALANFFKYDRKEYTNNKVGMLEAANILIRILFAPLTLGISLLWRPANRYSWGAFEHFRETISAALIVEGKPFSVVKVDHEERKKNVEAQPVTPVELVDDLFSNKTTTRKLSNTLPFDEGVLSILFCRMNSRTLFRSIRTLELTDCVSVNDEVLRLIALRCPNLQNLNLSFCVQVTNRGLFNLKEKKCLALGSVTLDGCTRITSEGVKHVAQCSGPNLWQLSLRSLPKISADVFIHIAEKCPNIRSLVFDVDVLYKEEAGRSESDFLAVDSKSLLELLKRCGASLRVLKLSNVMKNFKDFDDLASLLSPYIRSISLAGLDTLTHKDLRTLTKKTPFLRELRLSRASKLEHAKCLLENCHSLRVVSLGGTAVPMAETELLFKSGRLPDLEVAQIDHPKELVKFYAKQLVLQLEKYDAVRERLLHGRASSACFPLSSVCCGRDVDESSRVQEASWALEDGPQTAAIELERIHTKVEAIRELNEALTKRQFSDDLKYNDPDDMAVVATAVELVDYVRRARERRQLSQDDLEAWFALVGGREFEKGDALISMTHGLLETPLRGASDPAVPEKTPFVSLSSFGVMSTRRLNIKIDFTENKYEFICPSEFEHIYITSGRFSSKVLSGSISPLSDVTLNRSTGATKQLLQRFWFIPPNARYYCWAYPIEGLDPEKLDFRANQRYEDTPLRLLHFGGYLYFDADRHFVAASALTFGTALSFNGPFEIPKRSVKLLELEKRWHKVTILHLIPEDAESVEFCYIFSGETVLPEHLRKDHCQHGCFAYRITPKDGGPVRGFAYSITTVNEAILANPAHA